jgi:hypothetical protein
VALELLLPAAWLAKHDSALVEALTHDCTALTSAKADPVVISAVKGKLEAA